MQSDQPTKPRRRRRTATTKPVPNLTQQEIADIYWQERAGETGSR